MAPRLSGKTSMFGVVFFVFKSLGNWRTKETSEPCVNIDISNVAYWHSSVIFGVRCRSGRGSFR